MSEDRITLGDLTANTRLPRRRMAIAAALSIVAALSALAIPMLAGTSVNGLVEGNKASLSGPLAAIVGLLGLRLVFEVARRLIAGEARFRYTAELRQIWFGRILAIPPGGEGATHRQEWVSVLSYDVPRVAEFVVDLPLSLVSAICTLIGAVALMWALNPMLTLAVASLAPLGYLGARLAARATRQRAMRYWDLEIETMTRAEEAFRGRWAAQAFVQEPRLEGSFAEVTDRSAAAAIDHLRLLSFVGPATQFVSFVGMVGIVALASMLELAVTPGELLSFVLYGLLLSQPLRAFADGWGLWQAASATLGRFEAVRAALAAAPVAGSRTLDEVRGRIEIDHLEFGWRASELFDGASLDIAPGEHIALVGPNGVGKTTLISLLLGFVAPRGGTIRVDGIDLSSLTNAARRRLFAVVPQQPALVGATIREAVSFGAPDASEVRLREALRAALAAEFVDALEHGLDTPVGEDGASLSGGERQRLAVARALLMDAPILVLDEPTASYDAVSTDRFVARARELVGDRTVLWITHEDAPLQGVDRIVRLDGGEFAEGRDLAAAS